MTAILVRFEWHDDFPRSGTGPLSYTVHSSPPNDRSVQHGLTAHEFLKFSDFLFEAISYRFIPRIFICIAFAPIMHYSIILNLH